MLTTSAVSVASGAAAWSIVSWPGSRSGWLAITQPAMTPATATAAEKRASSNRRAQTSASVTSPGGHRHEQRREPAAGGEPVEQRPRVRPHDQQRDQRGYARHDAGAQRAHAERVLEVGQLGAARIASEEHRREVRARDHREHADRERGRVGPGLGVGGGILGAHLAGRDPAEHRAEEERHEHRGERERRAEHARLADRARLPAQRERRAAQDDPERREEQRDRQRLEDRAERDRERGPRDHQHEDQPHVVGLPHRAHRALHQPAHAPAAERRRPRSGPRSRRRSRLRPAPRRASARGR